MGNGFQYFDILLLAVIAGVIVLRLRSVLGRRDGHEPSQPGYDPFKKEQKDEQGDDKVIALPERAGQSGESEADLEEAISARGVGETSTPLDAGLTQVKLADRGFDKDVFANGAKAAFEMVIGAFAQGDTKVLRPLLSNDVFEDFSGAIKQREMDKETLETTLIGIKQSEVIEAELQGKTAFVTVKFVSEQVNVTHDAAGDVVDGDPNHVATITDIWTFARNTRSRDPNWTLVATRSSN